jgi:hypothetical protein
MKKSHPMKTQEILDKILRILSTIKEDQGKLQEILTFLENEFYESDGIPQIELPEKYQNAIKDIAESIDSGLVCFLNLDTAETEDFPKEMLDNPEELEAMTGVSFESLNFKHTGWENCVSFDPLESFESFDIMRQFTDSLEDKWLKDKLINALNNKKPFAHFKAIIDNSDYRQNWVDFKKQFMGNYVKELLLLELENKDSDANHEEINGFYDDDGNKVDPDTVPIPSLCVICKSHQVDDWEENLMCLMNRFDQKDDTDFKCGAFEKI